MLAYIINKISMNETEAQLKMFKKTRPVCCFVIVVLLFAPIFYHPTNIQLIVVDLNLFGSQRQVSTPQTTTT